MPPGIPAEADEVVYRLLVDEIPTAAAGLAINFKCCMSMPIFIAPTAAANLKLGWSISAVTVVVEVKLKKLADFKAGFDAIRI